MILNASSFNYCDCIIGFSFVFDGDFSSLGSARNDFLWREVLVVDCFYFYGGG